MSNPHRTVVSYYSRTLKPLLGDQGQQMRAIDKLQCRALAFQLKGCALQPLISRQKIGTRGAGIEDGDPLHIAGDSHYRCNGLN
jgi:hypothetical protein